MSARADTTGPAGVAGAWTAPLPALYLVSALAGTATGIFNPLTSALLAAHGIHTQAIGLVSSVFFMFAFLATPLARWALQRHGARACIVVGMVLTAGAAVLLPLMGSLPGWLAARALMGVGIGLYMVGGQTALGHLVNDAQRSVASALQALAFGLGMGVGPLLGTALYATAPSLAFFAGAALLLAGVPVAYWLLPSLRLQAQPPRLDLARGLALPLHAVFAYGVAEATLLTMYPVFLLQQSHGVGNIGVAFAAFVAGGLVSSLPLSHLSDRIGREKVLLGCALAGVVASGSLVFAHHPMLVAALSMLTGASLGPVYAIALAVMAQRVAHADLGAGAALFTAAFNLGSMVAPWLSGLIMARWGAQQVFTLTAILFATLALRLLRRGGATAGVAADKPP
jgi:MFS family permease